MPQASEEEARIAATVQPEMLMTCSMPEQGLAALWDIAKYYEGLKHLRLMLRARRWEFPIWHHK